MSETTQNAYRDDFCVHHNSMAKTLRYIKEMEENDRWVTVPSRSIEFSALPTDLTKVDEMLAAFFFSEDDRDIVVDTMKNVGLVAMIDGAFYCIRDCALKTIFERAKINGTALSRLTRESLAEVLNRCMLVSRGDALVYLSHGKISAMHGGDSSDYCVLPISELYETLEAELSSRFPDNYFGSGYSDHCFSTAIWSFPEQTEALLGAYDKELFVHGLSGSTLIPGIRFTTSNTAMSGANIYPYITDTTRRAAIRLGSAVKVPHKYSAEISTFQKEVEMLYPKFVNTAKVLNKLLNVNLFYPLNAMAEVMKNIKIPKKIAFETLEAFQVRHGDGPSTAHEAFWGISEAIFFMRADGASESKIAETEDKIARALHLNWTDYDIGGVMAA